MAGIKYQCEFFSQNGSKYRINLYHVDYSGTTIPFVAGPEGFQLTYEGETDSVYQTIKASSMQFDFVITEAPTTSGDPTTGNIYNDLLTNNENKMFVIVQQYDSDNTTYRNFWAGDIIDDVVEIEDAPYPVQIRIKSTDGIAKLKEKIYVPVAGGTGGTFLPVLFYFQEAISKTLYYSTLFPSTGGTSVITIRNNPDRYAENMGSITDSAWQDAYNPMKLTFLNESAFVGKDGIFMTYYEILEQICTLWGCQFFLGSIWNEDIGCTWWLFSRNIMYFESGNSILDTCRVFKNQAYNSSNNALNFAEYSIPNTSVNYTPTLTKTIGDADHPKFKGNKISYSAVLGKVKNIYNHDLFSYVWNTGDQPVDGTTVQYKEFSQTRTGSTTGVSYFGGNYAVTNANLVSPFFPDGMAYSVGGNNNQGLFIPVSNGQDSIIVRGELTLNYSLSFQSTILGTLLETASNSGTPYTFDFNAALVINFIASDKGAEDWMEVISNSGTTLNDTELFMFMKGDFGSFNGDGVCEWVDATDSNGFSKVHITELPITDAPQTITIPFCFISETIPTTFDSTTVKSLKRCRFTLEEYTDANRTSGALSSLSSSGITVNSFNYSIKNFNISSVLDGSEMGSYFSTSIGLFSNDNGEASAQMDITPELFIGDPPPYVSNTVDFNVPNGSPSFYLGGLKIIQPAASNPTTTVPNQAVENNRRWRTQQDGNFFTLHELLCREIIKKRAVPSFKYNISFQNSNPATTITFINTLKIDMKLNSGESSDLQAFFPIGGTYTAGTDSWKMVVEQISSNTTTNIDNDSYINVDRDLFFENPNIIISPNF